MKKILLLILFLVNFKLAINIDKVSFFCGSDIYAQLSSTPPYVKLYNVGISYIDPSKGNDSIVPIMSSDDVKVYFQNILNNSMYPDVVSSISDNALEQMEDNFSDVGGGISLPNISGGDESSGGAEATNDTNSSNAGTISTGTNSSSASQSGTNSSSSNSSGTTVNNSSGGANATKPSTSPEYTIKINGVNVNFFDKNGDGITDSWGYDDPKTGNVVIGKVKPNITNYIFKSPDSWLSDALNGNGITPDIPDPSNQSTNSSNDATYWNNLVNALSTTNDALSNSTQLVLQNATSYINQINSNPEFKALEKTLGFSAAVLSLLGLALAIASKYTDPNGSAKANSHWLDISVATVGVIGASIDVLAPEISAAFPVLATSAALIGPAYFALNLWSYGKYNMSFSEAFYSGKF